MASTSLSVLFVSLFCAVRVGAATPSATPKPYRVETNQSTARLVLSTDFYAIEHDLRRGGAISSIRLTHGQSTNLLVRPVETRLVDEAGQVFSDLVDSSPGVTVEQRDGRVIVTTQSRLAAATSHSETATLLTTYEYRWGYIKVHKRLSATGKGLRFVEMDVLKTVFAPALLDYGYREGVTEHNGAPPFSFGSNRWGKLGQGQSVRIRYLPRSLMLADPGVEGMEWFMASDMSQWDLQLSSSRGQGGFALEKSEAPSGVALTISPYASTNAIALPKECAFDFYLGLPLLEGHAQRPWLHASFNRNRGEWVSPRQVQSWADSGIQTVHCHNDGDYYEDGLFWRDGSYPPYPDMERFDQVIAECHKAGLRVATYFSNKELHPSTPQFVAHGSEWGRMSLAGKLQHNIYRGTNEFGVQMCLRSGWLGYLKQSIDRVLKNHALDGVYYDWNVALQCCNPLHEGKPGGAVADGHWDIDELLDLMEWTRQRVGPNGLVIVHNTTTPMFTMENFADDVVANEWGYGTWKTEPPPLPKLPLEWSLVGARSRGVISYGQLTAESPKYLHRAFALEALLSGVTPWPASPETFELLPLLQPIHDFDEFKFSDWRNQAVSLDTADCASAVWAKANEAYILLANLKPEATEVRCVVHPEKLSPSLAELRSAKVYQLPGGAAEHGKPAVAELDVTSLSRAGVPIKIPGTSAVMLELR